MEKYISNQDNYSIVTPKEDIEYTVHRPPIGTEYIDIYTGRRMLVTSITPNVVIDTGSYDIRVLPTKELQGSYVLTDGSALNEKNLKEGAKIKLKKLQSYGAMGAVQAGLFIPKKFYGQLNSYEYYNMPYIELGFMPLLLFPVIPEVPFYRILDNWSDGQLSKTNIEKFYKYYKKFVEGALCYRISESAQVLTPEARVLLDLTTRDREDINFKQRRAGALSYIGANGTNTLYESYSTFDLIDNQIAELTNMASLYFNGQLNEIQSLVESSYKVSWIFNPSHNLGDYIVCMAQAMGESLYIYKTTSRVVNGYVFKREYDGRTRYDYVKALPLLIKEQYPDVIISYENDKQHILCNFEAIGTGILRFILDASSNSIDIQPYYNSQFIKDKGIESYRNFLPRFLNSIPPDKRDRYETNEISVIGLKQYINSVFKKAIEFKNSEPKSEKEGDKLYCDKIFGFLKEAIEGYNREKQNKIVVKVSDAPHYAIEFPAKIKGKPVIMQVQLVIGRPEILYRILAKSLSGEKVSVSNSEEKTDILGKYKGLNGVGMREDDKQRKVMQDFFKQIAVRWL